MVVIPRRASAVFCCRLKRKCAVSGSFGFMGVLYLG